MVVQNLRYTEHAFERMAERDISRATVEAVVVAGQVEIEPGGVCRYTMEGLVVVVDGRNVVTVYFDSAKRQRSQWGPKQRQRRRRHLAIKPQYFEGRGYINIRQQAFYQRQAEEQ